MNDEVDVRLNLEQACIEMNEMRNNTRPKKTWDEFKEEVIAEMKDMGATENDIALLGYGAINNAIENKRNPEDLAWAILQ